MKTIRKSLLILPAFFCAALLPAEDSWPNAMTVLRRTTSAPAVAYQGVVTVGIRQGQAMRFEDVQVRFKPPNLYRWEYMAPDGKVERVVVNQKESGLQLAKQEWGLLLANYVVSIAGVDSMLGRPVWQLELTPRVPGKCHRRLVVDQLTGIILENKKFRPNRKETVMSRFVRFESPVRFTDDMFSQQPREKPAGHRCERVPSAQRKPFPQTLPNGFQLVGANAMLIGDNVITQMRYSDGLSVISVFQTLRPVNPAPHDAAIASFNHVVSQPVPDGHVTLIGDVPDDLLKEMALAFNK